MAKSARRTKRQGGKKRRATKKAGGRSCPTQALEALHNTEHAVIAAAKALPSDRPLKREEEASLLRRLKDHVIAIFAAETLKEGGKMAIEFANEHIPDLLDHLDNL